MELQDSQNARVSPTRIDSPRSIPLPEIYVTPASPLCDGPVEPRVWPVVKNEPLSIPEETAVFKAHPPPSREQTVNPFQTPDDDADGDSRLPDFDATSQVATQQGNIPGQFIFTQDTIFTDLSAEEHTNLTRTPMFAARGIVMSDSSGKEYANLEKPAEKPSEPQKHGKHASGVLVEEPRPKRLKGKHVKEEHAEKSTLFAGEPPFAFLSPNKDATTRLILKEQAIEVCMRIIGKCKKLLADEIDQEEEHDEGIEDIIARIDNIEQKSRGHQVLVGVCGGTGVGKTSLLNACLGFDELLPSGQEEASTAVPCLVSYNNDNREGYECRAEVFFHDKETITAELQSFLRAFAERTDAAEYGTLSEVEEFEAMITKGMDRFSPVWKFTEAQLEQLLQIQPEQCEVTGDTSHQDASLSGNAGEKAAIEWVFGLNPDVQQLLSEGIRSLHTSTIPELAKEVKRFLDSCDCIHGSSTALAFAAWPLVKEVRLYVKSDLLQQDICLVDLPGVGDINSSRNSVAGHYMSRLHLNIVVGSIVRGKDTKDFNELLGAQQQASMQLDGTLDRNHLAIVFTKIDDMQAHKYHFHSAEDEKRYKTLADGIIQRKAVVTSINQDIKRVERGITKARSTMEKKNATKESISRTRKAVAKVCKFQKSLIAKRDIVQIQAEILRQQQTHLAILARNQHVRSCVEENFGKKQKLLDIRRKPRAGGKTSSTTTDTPSQQMAEIFMTSSRAFWEIENKTRSNLCGLPNKQFTGVPALKQWIKKNAALHREGHMDDILSDLRVVLELMGTWARSASKSATLPEKRIDPRIIEASIEKVHEDQTKHIIDSINDTCDMIEGLDPLGDRQRLQRFFKRQESTIVERWNRKFPDDPTNHETLHHSTYAAIAHRSGCFKSATTQVSYNWTQKLAQPIIEGLVQSWQRALVDGVQDLKAKACDRIRWLWTPYARAILREIAPIDPSFKTEIAELERILEPSGVSLEKDVVTIVSDFQEKATRIHHETISPTLQSGLRECFSRVSRIKGQGGFLARQAFLKDATTEEADFLFNKVWRALNDLIKDHRAEAQRELRLLSCKSVAEVKTAVRFWLRGGCAHRGGETVSKVRGLVRSCFEDWTFPASVSGHEFSKKLGIPDELTADDFGHDHAVMSVNGVNYYDKIKKGAKVLVGKNASQKVSKALTELTCA